MNSIIELGKGIDSASTVNLFNVGFCVNECPFSNPKNQSNPKCTPHNRDAVILFPKGVNRDTTEEVRNTALCVNK